MHPKSRYFTSALYGIICSSLLFIWSSNTFAFGKQDNLPIKIQSDRAELNNQKGIAIYSGKVIVTQGDARLDADKVVIHSNEKSLQKIEAFGKPAHFSQKASEETPPTDAYGETITYDRASQLLKLIKSAKLQQNNNSFTGDVIEYDTLKGIINAHGSPSPSSESHSRVEIEFHPNQPPVTKSSEK